jgi:plastocyanin
MNFGHVLWGEYSHSLRFCSPSLDSLAGYVMSGSGLTNEVYDITYTSPGTYEYECIVSGRLLMEGTKTIATLVQGMYASL